MRNLVTLLMAAAFLAGASPVAAQDASYRKTVETFFTLIEAGKSDEAVEFLYSSNPWMARSADAVAQVRTRLKELPSVVGTLRNRELLQERVVGSRFVYLSYLAAYERQPIRFVFQFYRPEAEWMTFGFSFDDKLDDDVEAAAARDLSTPER
jgi:hypothetical protein